MGKGFAKAIVATALALGPLPAPAQPIDPSDIRLGIVYSAEQAVLCLSLEPAQEMTQRLADAGRQREPTLVRELPEGCHRFAGEFIPERREEALPIVTAWAYELASNGRDTCRIALPDGREPRARCRAQRRPFFFMWARSTQGEQRALVLMGTPSLQDQFLARQGQPSR